MNIQRFSIFRTTVTILLLAGITASCIKEEFDTDNFDPALSLTPGLAIPLGFSRLSLEDYLSDSLFNGELGLDSEGIVTLYFSAPVDSGIMGDLLTIRNSSASRSVINHTGSVISLSSPGANLVLIDSTDIPVTASETGIRIDSARLLSGTMQLNSVFTNLTGTVTYMVPELTRDGAAFSVTRNLSDPAFSLDLAGYTLAPGHNAAGDNLLTFRISLNLSAPSGPVIPGETIMVATASISSVVYEIIFGDFSGFNTDFPALTLSTDFFSSFEQAQIRLADPELRIYISNSAGVPLGIWFTEIYAIDRNNVHHPLTGSGIPSSSDPKVIQYPGINQVGQTIKDSLVINAANSNLPDFIAVNPDSVTIKGAGTVMPLPSPVTTFVRSDSRYNVSAMFELPLHGRADLLLLSDTIPFDYSGPELPPPGQLESLVVRTSITSSFPAEAWPQVYMLDQNYMVTDSLFTGTEKIEGATDTDGDGKANPVKQPPLDVFLPRSRIDNLVNASYLVARARISTTGFPASDVKIYPSSFIDFRIGVIAKLKVDTGDL